jgi:preprotein translocase YajC subunit
VNQQLILLLVVMAALFYLLIYRPQAKAKRQREALDRSLEAGRRVVTIGGLHGEIVAIDAETADVEIADGVVVTFDRRAISATAGPDDGADDENDEELDDEELDDEELDDEELDDEEFDDEEFDDEELDDEELDDEELDDAADEVDPQAVEAVAGPDADADPDDASTGDAGRPA